MPMKGIHLYLNEEILAFLAGALETLYGEGIWDDDIAQKHPEKILDMLEKAGWVRHNDKFGDKAILSTTYPASTPPQSTDELRVTVILQKEVLKLDCRLWGVY
jgi:hypothetical protein